jgi:S1-C subfamily serine protease
MRRSARIGVLSLLVSLFASATLGAGGIPGKTLKELKAASVYIKAEFKAVGLAKALSVTGSGFLIQANGTTGLIATNSHVVTEARTGFAEENALP